MKWFRLEILSLPDNTLKLIAFLPAQHMTLSSESRDDLQLMVIIMLTVFGQTGTGNDALPFLSSHNNRTRSCVRDNQPCLFIQQIHFVMTDKLFQKQVVTFITCMTALDDHI